MNVVPKTAKAVPSSHDIVICFTRQIRFAPLQGTQCTCQDKLKTMILNLFIHSGGGWGGGTWATNVGGGQYVEVSWVKSIKLRACSN